MFAVVAAALVGLAGPIRLGGPGCCGILLTAAVIKACNIVI